VLGAMVMASAFWFGCVRSSMLTLLGAPTWAQMVRAFARAPTIWALVEAPTILGLVGYLLTRDFRALLATLAGLLLFGNYRPSRLFEH